MTWEEIELGRLAIEGPTNGYSPAAAPNASGTLSLKLSATTQGRMLLSDETVKHLHETIPADSRAWLVPGDLLVQRSNTADLVGTAAIFDGPPKTYIYPDLMMRIRFVEPTTTKWVWRYLNSPRGRRYIRSMAAGAAGSMPKISGSKLKAMPIPLPPLAEQRRIVDLLDKADAIRRKRKEAIALTEELLRSTFLDMFGDPVTNPKGWPVKPLGELLDGIDSGWSPVCEARRAFDDEWGVLKLGAVTFGRYDGQENKALAPDLSPVPELEVRAGDVLFSRKNTYEHVAACVFVSRTRPKLMLPDLIFRFVPSKTSGLRAETLWALLSNERMRKQVQRLAGGTAGSMPNISKERLKTVNLPAPPAGLQERFATAVVNSEATRIALESAATEAETLFNSLVARAFSGGLSA